MFRPLRAATALLALTLLTLGACADSGANRTASPASAAPAVSAPSKPVSSKPVTSKPGSPAVSKSQDDPSLRLSGDTSGGGSCRQQCERGNNICMDSVAARVQSGVERPDAGGPFTPVDNCSYQLRSCYQRCGAAP